ncbi:hypothetical protein G9C98_008129 [Cotesia typhae]|uniref:Uncharacterized protein n=1 Tax=Cotesia typhae TaxID=2053667 RepID=A0A8J5RE67_9HYME|nr:hypothetical protein G9C98_008129 [Cotesia typhae]
MDTSRRPISSTYKRTTYNNYPTETPATRLSKDQQEFDEALGTLTRRRKNTWDYPSTTSSRYGSSLTVNGDPGRIYDGLADENENMPEDYVFKRVNHDSMAGVRKSNLSINSCVSMTSVYASGRKKRRAPPPPSPRDVKPQLKVKVEIKKQEETRCEIIKDVEIVEDKTLLRKKSKESIGSDSSFSVKDEIEKIERQIKLLEATKAINNDEKAALRTRTYSLTDEDNYDTPGRRLIRGSSSRRSLQENRRNFFKELTSRSSNNININNNINHSNDRVKVEIKELPRQQNDIKIVHLTDEVEHHDNGEETVDNSAVKVIELRISEPLKVKSDFNFEVNPIPKPVRHNSNCSLDKMSTVNINNNNNIDNNNKNISTVDVNDNNRDNEEQSL